MRCANLTVFFRSISHVCDLEHRHASRCPHRKLWPSRRKATQPPLLWTYADYASKDLPDPVTLNLDLWTFNSCYVSRDTFDYGPLCMETQLLRFAGYKRKRHETGLARSVTVADDTSFVVKRSAVDAEHPVTPVCFTGCTIRHTHADTHTQLASVPVRTSNQEQLFSLSSQWHNKNRNKIDTRTSMRTDSTHRIV